MRPSLRNFAVIALAVAMAACVYFARHVLVPFLLAAVIAYTLDPVVSWLERRRVGRGLGALLVMAALGLVLAGALSIAIPEIIEQVAQFTERLPDYREALRGHLGPLTELLEKRFPGQLEAMRAQMEEVARATLPAAAGWVVAAVKGAFASLARLILWMLTIVVVPVFSYYLLVDHREIRATLESLVPAQARPAVERHVAEIDSVLRAWLKGQLTVAVLLAFIYAVGLGLLGVPLGPLIGALGGLANLVPYMGLVVGLLPAVLLAFLDTGGWLFPLLVVGVFALGQTLEGTVISPRIVGKGLGLPPALVLLAVLVGGELFGFTGLLLAVPATAAGLVVLRDLRSAYDLPDRAAAPARPSIRRRRPAP